MLDNARKLAVVTGASSGIGLELARECAKNKFDLLIAANEPEIEIAGKVRRTRPFRLQPHSRLCPRAWPRMGQ
jgi:short-subunit dehydrogenase